jgi:hypothetical protein
MTSFFFRAMERRTVRRAVATDCQVVTDTPFELIGERAIDLSRDGMLVVSDASPALGEELIVSFRVPGTRLWLDAEAEVARVLRGRRALDRARAVGLRFTRMDTLTRAVLDGSLVGRPPPVPARRARRDYARTVQMIHRASW